MLRLVEAHVTYKMVQLQQALCVKLNPQENIKIYSTNQLVYMSMMEDIYQQPLSHSLSLQVLHHIYMQYILLLVMEDKEQQVINFFGMEHIEYMIWEVIKIWEMYMVFI